jgi:hypothetical protein
LWWGRNISGDSTIVEIGISAQKNEQRISTGGRFQAKMLENTRQCWIFQLCDGINLPANSDTTDHL